MPKEKNPVIIGNMYGRLTVKALEYETILKKSRKFAVCDCTCGNETRVRCDTLKSSTKSCGCIREELNREKMYKLNLMGAAYGTQPSHGHAKREGKSPTYNSWRSMNQRCNDINNPIYSYYGGRGINVCERWKIFTHFLEDMGERPKGKSLDRINNELGYFPENCRWATRSEQARNRRDTHLISYNGETKSITSWAEDLGMNRLTLRERIVDMNWDIEKALTTPVKKKQ